MPHRPALAIALLLVCVPAATGAQQARQDAAAERVHPAGDVPVVTVRYSALLDGACADLSGRALDSARVAMVRRRESSYAALWAARGPALLRTAREAVGVPYPMREMHAALSTCWPGSMSFPLIISLGAPRQTRADSAAADLLFVNTLFHEFLHTYINHVRGEATPDATPLLAKHRAEPYRVRNHLHLLALQRLVYERLGLGAELQLMLSADRAYDPAVLGRAHEIVDAEGAAAFVRELEAAARTRNRAP